MANLEDKLTGENLQYYCSSSEDEEPETTAVDSNACSLKKGPPFTSNNTGPKGVVQDWLLCKQLEEQSLVNNTKKNIELAKRMCLTTKTDTGDANQANEKLDLEFRELMSEEFLLRFQKQRIAEIMEKSNTKIFGKVGLLKSSDEFINAVDKEETSITVVIHIFDSKNPACKKINEYLEFIAADYKTVKFCKINCQVAGMSQNFYANGLPALLIYRGKELVGNHVRLTDELSNDFFSSDFETFLIENNVIIDKSHY